MNFFQFIVFKFSFCWIRIQGCHRLRGRRAGSSLYLDVHIEVGSPEFYNLFIITCIILYVVNSWWDCIMYQPPDLLVRFTLQVDPFSSVSAAHDIGENVRHQIHKSHPTVAETFIHIGLFHSSIYFLHWSRPNLIYLVSQFFLTDIIINRIYFLVFCSAHFSFSYKLPFLYANICIQIIWSVLSIMCLHRQIYRYLPFISAWAIPRIPHSQNS